MAVTYSTQTGFYAGGQQGLFKFVEEHVQLRVADQQGRQQAQHAAVTTATLEDQARFEAFLLQQGRGSPSAG